MVSDLRRIAFVVALLPGVAWASNPSAADRETARTYMAEGRKARDDNDLKAALRAFEAADTIMHVPTTGLEVARTETMLGQLVEARDVALRVARSQREPGEPAPFGEARVAAQKLADDLEARIPSIRVTLKNAPPSGVAISIDGAPMPSIAIGLGRKLDPGNHVIVAKAGETQRTINVQVLERESKEVPIDLNAPAEPTNAATPTVAEPTPTAPAGEPRPRRGPWMPVGVAMLAAGGAGIVVGAITGAMSLAQTSSIQAQCTGNVCPPTLKDGSSTTDAIAGARTLATISDVGFIAGGVLAATGVVFVVLGSMHGKSSVALSPGIGSVLISGQF